MKKLLLVMLLLSTIALTGCWQSAEVGEVYVQTIEGKGITKVINGGTYVSTWDTWYDSYYRVTLRPTYIEVPLSLVAKDGAGFQQTVVIAVMPLSDEESIKSYVAKYGLNEESRVKLIESAIKSEMGTQAKNSFNMFDSYALNLNQEAVQTDLTNRFLPFLKANHLQLDGKIQLKDKPNFDDDRIDTAASAVVANKKLEEAETALKNASEIKRQRLEIEAKTFENPKMYTLELQRLKIQEAEAWSKHQGSLFFGSGAVPTIDIK